MPLACFVLLLEPLAQVVHDFEQYLRQDRGLCETSIIRHRPPLKKFLHQYCSVGVIRLTGKDVTHFLVQHAHDQSLSSAMNMCLTLRAFSRYLLYQGRTAYDLSAAVPSIRAWRLTNLSEHLSADQIKTVLNSCDRCSAVAP